MKVVAASFAWPFRGDWRPNWLIGLLATLFVPVLFVPLLGYAIAATRAAVLDPASGPPPWRLSRRLLTDGLWTSIAIALLTLPFLLALNLLSTWLFDLHLWRASDPALSNLFARVLGLCILALPWGLVLLLLMPHAVASFAAGGRVRDLFDPGAALRGVRRDFTTWNLAAAAIVTAWAVGISCTGLLCVGLVPGVYYAILVSANASAALHQQSEPSSAG